MRTALGGSGDSTDGSSSKETAESCNRRRDFFTLNSSFSRKGGLVVFACECAHVCLCENEAINTDRIKNKRQLFAKLKIIFSNILLPLHETDPHAVEASAFDFSYPGEDFLIHMCILHP